MTLIKWMNRPTLFDDVNHLIDSFSTNTPISFYNKNNNWVPQFEVRQSDDSYQIFAELPGMSKKNINVEVVDNVLIISGEKSKSDEDQSYYSEISYGEFHRTFNLPDNILDDKVSAKMKDGILAIYIPKVEEVKPEVKKIAIK